MTANYVTIDREALVEQMGRISETLQEPGPHDYQLEEVDEALGEINRLVHDVEKPVHIEEHEGRFEILVSSPHSGTGNYD